MKHYKILVPIILKQTAVIVAANDSDHPFIRRVQDAQLPQCGFPNPCWCDVNALTSTSTTCPAYPADSIYTPKTDVADFFAALELGNPDYKDLQLCSPDLSTSINLDGTSVDPNILCDEGILVGSKAAKQAKKLSCMKDCKSHPENAVCGIKLMYNGGKISPDEYSTDCTSNKAADSYVIKTFRNDEERQKKGYFSFHEGACGVCSTAQDMASFMRHSFLDPNDPYAPTIDTMSFLCHMAITLTQDPSPKDLVDQVSMCLQYGIPGVVPAAHLSPTCAYAWAINVFLTGLPEESGGCNLVCTDMLNRILKGTCTPDLECPYSPVDCSLQPCLQCDDSVSGDQFIELAGMTRRYAGIHTLLPRPCGALANISHTCVAEL